MTIDFTKIDGEQFEELCEDLFKAMGYDDPPPERSGRGPDGGRDLIITEHRHSGVLGAPRRFRWLVECKNFAKSNKSVQPQDIGSITDKVIRHHCDGYLLITTTIPSTNVETTITETDKDQRLGLEATYWARPRLIDELRKHRTIYEKYFGTPAAEAVALAHWSKRNPFLELFAYEEAHSRYFFGRETDIRDVIERVYRSNLILLYGQSGVGKTSLIHAGLTPVLRSEGVRVANIQVTPDLSSAMIVDRIRSAVPQHLESVAPEEIKDEQAFSTLVGRLARSLRNSEQRLVVILDQFESIFQGVPRLSNQLGEDLASAAPALQQYASVSFLFSLRSDFLDRLGLWVNTHHIPELWRNSYPLQKLTDQQAREVLTSAPAIVGAQLTGETVAAIVSDLERLDEGLIYPPNLQIVVSSVFETARSQADPKTEKLKIGLESYEAVGGAEGIIESFLAIKLAEFGENAEMAHQILVALVSATGRRLGLSKTELMGRLDQPSEVLVPILNGLVQSRLIRLTDRPETYELVHDVLATKVLETTEEERRRVKAAQEAFELAVATWETEGLHEESTRRLNWFYQYRHSLRIGPRELFFLLISETSRGRSSDPFSLLDEFFSSALFQRGDRLRQYQRGDRLRWINQVSPVVCLETLDLVLDTSTHPDSNRDLAPVLVTDLFSASSFEVQKDVTVRLELIAEQPFAEIYYKAYQNSPIPTPTTLSYLQDFVTTGLTPNAKRSIAYRLLEHYRRTFPPYGSSQDWVAKFPVNLIDHADFCSITLDYLRKSKSSGSSGFKIELLKLLYERQPDKTVETLWAMVRVGPGLHRTDTGFLQLLRIYDPERTIDKVVQTLSQDKYIRSETSIALLEALDAPEADDLLIKDLEKYTTKFKGGSKRWRGGALQYWRKSITKTIQTIGRRRLKAAVPYLVAIATRYETEKVKIACVNALASIGGQDVAKALVETLDDRSVKVRNKASNYLIEMISLRDAIVKEIIGSIHTQADRHRRSFRHAKRADALKKKIATLRKLGDPEAIKVLQEIAQNDADESVRRSAERAARALQR